MENGFLVAVGSLPDSDPDSVKTDEIDGEKNDVLSQKAPMLMKTGEEDPSNAGIGEKDEGGPMRNCQQYGACNRGDRGRVLQPLDMSA